MQHVEVSLTLHFHSLWNMSMNAGVSGAANSLFEENALLALLFSTHHQTKFTVISVFYIKRYCPYIAYFAKYYYNRLISLSIHIHSQGLSTVFSNLTYLVDPGSKKIYCLELCRSPSVAYGCSSVKVCVLLLRVWLGLCPTVLQYGYALDLNSKGTCQFW